jgi:hypothetical protein
MSRMALRVSRRALVIGLVAAAVIAGCGGDDDEEQAGGSDATTRQTTPREPAAEPASDLAARALREGELQGFEPTGSDATEDDARSWLTLIDDSTVGAKEYAKSGFVAGLKRDLESTEEPGIYGLNLVVQFGAAAQAVAEVARYIKSTPETETIPFPVSGLPGAEGFTAKGATVGDNVAFSKGSYFYEVGRVRQPDLTAKESRATVIAAAKTLHARVPR